MYWGLDTFYGLIRIASWTPPSPSGVFDKCLWHLNGGLRRLARPAQNRLLEKNYDVLPEKNYHVLPLARSRSGPIAVPPTMFAMFYVTGASRHMASRHVATMLNHASSDGIGGERDVHGMTVGVQDMTAGAAKGVTPTAKRSQRLGEMHGARHPARRTRASNSEFRLQACGSPVHLLSPSAPTCIRASGSGGRVCR